MTKKLSLLALMTCLAGSLAFAGDKATSSSSPAATLVAASDNSGNAGSAGETPCPTTNEKKKANKAKPAPSKEEQEFDHMLLGIHG